jgi:hypothetical protein
MSFRHPTNIGNIQHPSNKQTREASIQLNLDCASFGSSNVPSHVLAFQTSTSGARLRAMVDEDHVWIVIALMLPALLFFLYIAYDQKVHWLPQRALDPELVRERKSKAL